MLHMQGRRHDCGIGDQIPILPYCQCRWGEPEIMILNSPCRSNWEASQLIPATNPSSISKSRAPMHPQSREHRSTATSRLWDAVDSKFFYSLKIGGWQHKSAAAPWLPDSEVQQRPRLQLDPKGWEHGSAAATGQGVQQNQVLQCTPKAGNQGSQSQGHIRVLDSNTWKARSGSQLISAPIQGSICKSRASTCSQGLELSSAWP